MFLTIELYLHLNCVLLNWIVWNRSIFIKMDLALNNVQRLICHKPKQPTTNKYINRISYYIIYNGWYAIKQQESSYHNFKTPMKPSNVCYFYVFFLFIINFSRLILQKLLFFFYWYHQKKLIKIRWNGKPHKLWKKSNCLCLLVWRVLE